VREVLSVATSLISRHAKQLIVEDVGAACPGPRESTAIFRCDPNHPKCQHSYCICSLSTVGKTWHKSQASVPL